MCTLVNRETGDVLIEQLEIAASFWTRFVGLQFRRTLPPNAGLLIAPCSSVHTFGVRFAIDVAFIDASGVVVEVRESLKPCRVCIPQHKCRFVVETIAGARRLAKGMQIEVQTQSAVPRSISGIARPK